MTQKYSLEVNPQVSFSSLTSSMITTVVLPSRLLLRNAVVTGGNETRVIPPVFLR